MGSGSSSSGSGGGASWRKSQPATAAGATAAASPRRGQGGSSSQERLEENYRALWQRESQAARHVQGSDGVQEVGGWRIVRVFVSSTFADFHAEREALVKQVFPCLREWCESRRLRLCECDLRWGVPAGSSSASVLQTCLGELDRCHGDTRGRPFFLGLVGHRCGWIPSPEEVPEEMASRYAWVPGFSVTAMEIAHGAYRSRNPNAVFYVRRSNLTGSLPEWARADFAETEARRAAHVAGVRAAVLECFAPSGQAREYDCRYAGDDSGTDSGTDSGKRILVSGLEEFSVGVLSFFQEAIQRQFPDRTPGTEGLSWERAEHEQHRDFLETRRELVLGRDREMRKMLSHICRPPSQAEAPDSDEELPPVPGVPLLVQAEPGMGKSSLMARCVAATLKMPRLSVFYHFIGCCPSSTELINLLKRLCCHVNPPSKETLLETLENCTDEEACSQPLQEILEAAGEGELPLVIFVDALDQFSSHASASHLVSALLRAAETGGPHGRSTWVLSSAVGHGWQRGAPSWSGPLVELGPLAEDAARDVATAFLQRFNKRLDLAQMSSLTANPGARLPLWLALACEELRVFGSFEGLSHHVASLPADLPTLLAQILGRVTVEDLSGLLGKMLCLLECAPHALAEVDLRCILGGCTEGGSLPMMQWAQTRRGARGLLRGSLDDGGLETVGFCHNAVGKAVQSCLLSHEGGRHGCLIALADHFEGCCRGDEGRWAAVATVLPRLLREAGLDARLVAFLRRDPRGVRVNFIARQQFLKDLRCKMTVCNGFSRKAAIMCQTCAFSVRAFGQMFLNKDSCAICGTAAHTASKAAYLCHIHQRLPNREDCFLCGRALTGTGSQAAVRLCHMCGFREACVHLVGT
ncbi:telomerase protein component 1-like isoform X2 [Petromyzon marinus]|uniref:telomerase protein component 1-like isoform X2 n=1 Tax=Petromyzon marinus TaxID=7757 RepID=UPI003F6F01F5